MTQPISSSSSQNYTPYDPSQDQSRVDGTGGASGANPTSAANGGARGASNATDGQPPPKSETRSACVAQLVDAVTDCGMAYLAQRARSPNAALEGARCLMSLKNLHDCATDEPASSKAP